MLILYLSLSACTSWRPNQVTPQAALQTQHPPKSLRVTFTDSSTVVIDKPRLQGDTIVGLDATKTEVRVPLDSVLLTETRQGDSGKSLLAALGLGAVAFAIFAAVYVISVGASSDLRR